MSPAPRQQHAAADQARQVIPTSFAQQRFWVLDQLEPQSAAYTLSMALHLRLPVDVAALQQSLAALIQRHAILRTSFQVLEGQPMQVIAPHLPLPLEDLCNRPAARQEAAVMQLASQQAQPPFDLTHGPLLRTTLVRLAPQEHLLLLTLHQSICDGWSLGLFCQELASLYTAYAAGQPATLPPALIQYADYALWQRQWLQGEHLAAELAYWQQQLAGAPTMLALPTDRPRPSVPSRRGARYVCQVPQPLSEALEALSRQEGVTLYMTLVAAFLAVLHRYSGQQDLLLGTITAGRNRAELEPVLGCFINTLLLRADLSGNPPFRELLQRVRTRIVEALAHQEVPFEAVLHALPPTCQVDQTPPVQVLLTLDPPLPPLPPGWTLTPLAVETGASKCELSIELEDRPEGLVGRFEYSTDLFEEATIARLAGHWQRLLEGIVQEPQQRVGTLPLLPEAEREQLLVAWNATACDYPREQCLHQLFEAQVERSPEAVAVVFEQEELTYRDLNRKANQLAHHLQRLGVGPEVLVGLCVERSLEMVVGLLGILKAGGAYVPFDPTYPKERLTFMLDDMQATVVLTQARLVRTLPAQQAQVICLDSDWQRIAHEDIGNPLSGVGPDNLAYVIYTSGSTGQPKGAMNTHRGICNRLLWMQDAYQLTETDRVLQKTPFSFDVSVWEFFWPLLTGARLIVARPEGHQDRAYLLTLIAEQQITTLHFVPSMLQVFLEEPGLERCHSLRHVFCSGEVLPFELQECYFARHTAALHNLYGPTEASIDVTFWACKRNSERRTVPIGRPIANTQIYLLDRYGQPVPIGVPGELHIGGVGLARGYLNRPELTAERFIPNPFSAEPGARLYKTGDLARYLPDGTIEFLGRLDHQVKLRGFRIELGEIEAVLSRHPAVREVVVVAREDTPGDKRLVAYVVLQQRVTIPELRRFLQQHLPAYMIPAAFVPLEALPLTPNGKVDHRVLPAPDAVRPAQEEIFVAPRTATEEVVASIWTEVLGFERIGIYDNFFELGGHSLAATRIVSRVREAFQVELPLRWFFDAPSIAELARVLEENDHEELDQQFFPLQPAPRDGYLPLSFAQKRVWFIQQLVSMNIAYIAPTTLRLTGVLDVAVLEQCINELARRHEVLRTTFPSVDGQPVQLIHAPQPMNLPLIDLQVLPKIEREKETQQLIEEEIRKPFDIAQLPLIRWTLVRLDAQEHVLVLVEHHLVHDGWSINLLLGELFELYKAFSAGKPSPLPYLPIQFADFAYWQHQWMQGERAQKQLAYWKEKLAGSPPLLELPTDRSRPPIPSFRGAKPRIQLPPSQCKALRVLCRQEGVTQFMALLAIFLTLLHRYSKQEDICVGSGIANRRWRETESMVGMIINTVVLRTDLSDNPTFRELLKRVCEVTLEASANQDLPFEEVVKALQPRRNLSYNPIFQVMFSIHDAPMPHLELPGMTIELLEVLSNGSAKFDLNIVVIPRPEQPTGWNSKADSDGMTMLWEYSSDLFDTSSIARMVTDYQVLLENIIANPEQRLSDVSLLKAQAAALIQQ